MPTSSRSGVLELFPPKISFYASVKPIVTFSLLRQRACGSIDKLYRLSMVEDSVRSVGTDS